MVVCVGKERVEFHVHEAKIRKLPFFRNALQAELQKTGERRINMPDDNSAGVSGLLEWIYTENFRQSRLDWMNSGNIDKSSENTVLELAKFYLALGEIADKYDCGPLWNKVNEDFPQIIKSVDEIEQLRIWKLAYSSGRIHFPDCSDSHQGIRETRGWVQRLCTDNKEEFVQALSEFPELAYDLLRVTSTIGFMEDHMWQSFQG